MSICLRCDDYLDDNGNHMNGLNICDDILINLKSEGLVVDDIMSIE